MKYNYDKSEWAPSKKCYYCGVIFYPLQNENFCSRLCEQDYTSYIEDCEYIDLQKIEDEFYNDEPLSD